MKEGFAQIATAAGNMPVFFAHPEQDGPFPAVVIYMDFWGAREELYEIARWLATIGLYCSVPDIYYRQGKVLNQIHDAGGKMISLRHLDKATHDKVLAPLSKLSEAEVLEDTSALLQYFSREPAVRPGARACLGFCLGGRLAIRASSRFPDDFKVTASMHGSWLVNDKPDSPHRLVNRIQGELYCGFAEIDNYTPPSTMDAITAAMRGAPATFNYSFHKGAEHGYALPNRDIYDRKASLRDWEMIIAMIQRQLKPYYNCSRKENSLTDSSPRAAISQLKKSTWEKRGLRGFLEYRDLGVAEVTNGRFGANVARALHAHQPGKDAPLHYHDLGFHLSYIIKGWMRTYMDGIGEVVLHAGDCVTYEGSINQAHTEYSKDYEVLQITMPAEFPTVQVKEK